MARNSELLQSIITACGKLQELGPAIDAINDMEDGLRAADDAIWRVFEYSHLVDDEDF